MASTALKFEHSPADSLADSFVSTPGSYYPSLFPPTMGPADVMTPESYNDDDDVFDESMAGSVSGSMAGTPAPEKKAVKKRKSWGQQLPEPKTNLPPRKRAKTEDEKEQRRVERVLRNRRAAQSSRERKRQEVEALEAEKHAIERRNQDLEMRLADMEAKNMLLMQQIEQITGQVTVFGQSSSSPSGGATSTKNNINSSPRHSPTPVTLSKELFSSRDHNQTLTSQSVADATLGLQSSSSSIQSSIRSQTVNPAALSPEMRPVLEEANASSIDMTQHPAAMLCDLQCQSMEQRPWMPLTPDAKSPLALSQTLATMFLMSIASQAISTILSPLSQIIYSLRTGSCLSSTPSILSTILWLVTTTASLTTTTITSTAITTCPMATATTTTTASTSTTSSTRMKSPPRPSRTTTAAPPPTRPRRHRPTLSLRMRLLRRLLACSPDLARPLMDATTEAMRSAFEQQILARGLMVDGGDGVTRCAHRQYAVEGEDVARRSGGGEAPPMEALMTLLWAIKVIDRERTASIVLEQQQQRRRVLVENGAEAGAAGVADDVDDNTGRGFGDLDRLFGRTRRIIVKSHSLDAGTPADNEKSSVGWRKRGTSGV